MASQLSPSNKRPKFICIHLGASNKSTPSEKLTKQVKKLCESYMNEEQVGMTNQEYQAEYYATKLLSDLEDIPFLNCGYGSNLNLDGIVECDASLMCDRSSLWVGVGAVNSCKNPILLAKSLYLSQTKPRPLGLVQPNLLVSNGAKDFMKTNCPSLIIHPSKMISPKAFDRYQALKSLYDNALKIGTNQSDCEVSTLDGYSSHNNAVNNSRLNTLMKYPDIDASQRYDTVGVIVIDSGNNFCGAISSGGILLKPKGRVGQAAIPGAGVWANNGSAVTTTGVGEYLSVNLFAKTISDKLEKLKRSQQKSQIEISEYSISSAIQETFNEFTHSSSLDHVDPDKKFAGFLSVTSTGKNAPQDAFYMSFGHNSNSMSVIFMSKSDSIANSRFSVKLPSDSKLFPNKVETIKIK